jgi:hypothetical protein
MRHEGGERTCARGGGRKEEERSVLKVPGTIIIDL